MAVAFDPQSGEIVQGLGRANRRQLARPNKAADCLQDFEIYQMRCVERFTRPTDDSRDSLAGRCTQQEYQSGRCIEDD